MAYTTLETTSDNGLSVQQKILAAMKTKLAALEDQGAAVFRKVVSGDLEDLENEECPAAGVDFGLEELFKTYGGCNHYNWPMFFHFRFRGGRGVDEQDVYLYYLGILKKAVLEDHNLDGLTTNIVEESNTHTIIGIEDVYPGGTLSVTVQYRTRLHNPYKLITEAP